MSDLKPIYINPLTDFGFKLLFGQEGNKEFLLSFLNAVMNEPEEIVDAEFVDKEMINEEKDGRALIYDLHCKLADGRKIIVEMQNRYQTYFKDRSIFYLSSDICHQAVKGDEWDYRLTPVYGIFLMNFDWREVADKHLREDVCLMNMRTHEVFSDKMTMTFLKIPMMVKDAEDCRDTLDKWLYILKNMEKMEAMPTTFMKEPVFRRLGEVAKVAALDKKERREYEKSLKIYRDSYAIFATERREGFVEGLAEGEAKGRAEGRAEGLAEGEAKGKAILIKNLSSNGMTVSDISSMTGLTPEETERLLKL
ncbi:MAG: Rpn family recombination-promoting nuclease/putative transposase [Muribaculum sp.]|nr:Rpn family recombination-promoting nuclease/putative transposase [Muribaculum sp.]